MADEWDESKVNLDDFEMTVDDVDPEGLGKGGSIDMEGWYHLEVATVVNELNTVNDSGKEKSPAIRFDCVVLEAVEGQSPAGAMQFERIYVGSKGGGPPAEGSKKNAIRFGLGLGLIKEVERDGKQMFVDAATGKPNLTIAMWHKAERMQFIAKIVKETDDKFADKFTIPYMRVFQVDDPSVAKIPKNAEALALLEKSATETNEKPAKMSGKESSETATAAASSEGDGGLGDLSDL